MLTYSNDKLADFYENNYPAELGNLRGIEEDLAAGNFIDAATGIANFDPQSNIQYAYKTFFQLYLAYRTNGNLSEEENTALLLLANQCPFSDGPAVFKARALYDFINFSNEVYYDEDCPEKGYSGRAGHNDESALNVLLAVNESKKISKKINADFILFPNPANDKVFIRSRVANGNITVVVSDVLGRVFITKGISLNSTLSTIDLDLPNGVYFITLYGENKVAQTRKIIISK